MNIYYPWFEWAYSHLASLKIQNRLNIKVKQIIWLKWFEEVWDAVWDWHIWVLPIENSYAWSVHQNFYNFLRYDYKIIWEIIIKIDHCLVSKNKSIKRIDKVYSHPQALAQCYNYLKKHNIQWFPYQDTAWAAKMISEDDSIVNVWAICSQFAWKLYWLNILEEKIQDQDGNSTRFVIVTKKWSKIKYQDLKNKTTVVFETKNIPASLYKCLWWFATNWINLTKIESLPSLKWHFTYLFWLEFEWNLHEDKVMKSLDELKFFTKYLKVLWTY